MSDPNDEDLAARKHTAAHDPAFPARREAAYAAIIAALGQALEPLGYTLKGSTFSRATPQGKSAVHLQRSRYGWDAQIVLRFVTPEGAPRTTPTGPRTTTLPSGTSPKTCPAIPALSLSSMCWMTPPPLRGRLMS